MEQQELDALRQLIVTQLAPGKQNIAEDTALFSSRFIHSRNLMRLIDFLEKKCAIRISPVDMTLANLDSLSAIKAFVSRKRGRAAA